MLVTYPMKVPLDMDFTIDYSLNDTVADFYSFGRMEKVKSKLSSFSDIPERESFSGGFEFRRAERSLIPIDAFLKKQGVIKFLRLFGIKAGRRY